MKLSLSFQPFVKPMYKEFCIQKIQQTVTEIKHHFKFSKKQHIYQPQSIQTQPINKPLKTAQSQEQMNRTVKNSFYSKEKVKCERRPDSPQQYQFSDKRVENSDNKSNRNRKLSNHLEYPKQNQEKLQKQQLIEFLQKVDETMKSHTQFYQNIMQKIQLMDKKQLNLQKMINQLNNLSYQRKDKNLKIPAIELPQKLQTELPLVSVTFRNNRFVDQAEQQQTYQYHNEHRIKLQTQKHKRTPQKRQNKSQSQKKNQQKKLNKDTYFQQKQMINDLNQHLNSNKISQNVDFLIGFMKLEQQFNKIKKKSQYNQFQQLMRGQIS